MNRKKSNWTRIALAAHDVLFLAGVALSGVGLWHVCGWSWACIGIAAECFVLGGLSLGVEIWKSWVLYKQTNKQTKKGVNNERINY